MRRRTTIALVGAATAALVMGAIPALAAPAGVLDTAAATTPQEEPPTRECVDGYEGPTFAPDHAGAGTYFDDVLADPSCSGVPQERMSEECIAGMAGMFPCRKVDLSAFIPLEEMGSTFANDIWGWTDPQSGREYAVIGLGDGTGFIDVTRAKNPRYLGKLPTHTVSSAWRDIKVFKNHAYIVSEAAGHGLQVFDLTRLRGVTEPRTFTEDAWKGGFGQAHNIAINEDTGFAYVIGATTGVTLCGTGGGGPIMFDINTPEDPELAGCVPEDGYTHDTQCVVYAGPDTAHQGKEICLSSNEDTITVVDVDDKTGPVQLDRVAYAGSGYTHQAWLTPDHKYLLSDDELDESQGTVPSTTTYIWDVRNLDNIELIGQFEHGTQSIDHNLYITGNYTFNSNYMSGVRVLENTNIADAKLTKAGFFDVYPVADAVDFAGTWSNYPFFESKTVIATGMEEGLFVLKPSRRIRNGMG